MINLDFCKSGDGTKQLWGNDFPQVHDENGKKKAFGFKLPTMMYMDCGLWTTWRPIVLDIFVLFVNVLSILVYFDFNPFYAALLRRSYGAFPYKIIADSMT